MKLRLQIGIALAVLSFPLVGLGLLDPLEGLPALILGLLALIIARMATTLRVPKLAWIPLLITIFLLAVALILITLELQAANFNEGTPQPSSTTVGNPLAGPASLLLWASRISLITLLVGIGLYIGNLLKALRKVSKTEGN